jgi:hypothetical protein
MRDWYEMRDLDVKPSSALHHSAPEKAPEGGSLLEVLQA